MLLTSSADRRERSTLAPVAELRAATVGYDERPVLRGVSFRLNPGEVVAVLGPNGSGKSTLVKGLLGLAPLLGGDLELFGVPASRFADRARLGYVPQRQTLGGGLPSTVAEVVSSGRLARRRGLRPQGAADRAAVQRAIDTVDLSGRERDPVATLSGGQQRRVLIARALAGEPDVLVMDEPMAGVDAGQQQSLSGTLAMLAHAGTTLLLVAHELGPVAPLITRVVQMRDGRIAADHRAADHRATDHRAADHRATEPAAVPAGAHTGAAAAGPAGIPAGVDIAPDLHCHGADDPLSAGSALGLTR